MTKHRLIQRLAGGIFTGSLFSMTTPAHANPISPSLWPPVYPMLAANVVIGLVEAMLLVVFFKAAMTRAVPAMILGNIVSAIIGFPAMLMVHESDWIFYTADAYPRMSEGWQQITCVFVAYLLAIAIELPFVAFSIARNKDAQAGNEKNSPWRAWKASWLVQSATYAICVPLLYLLLDQPFNQFYYHR